VVGAVIADANGALQFLDASATNHPTRFYRIRVQ
jgi:hypothetical protein